VVFLFVGEFTHRKGIDILINAYARAFGPADDVTLVVKTWSSRTAPGDIEAAVRSRLDAVSASPPHTVFLHGMLPDELLPSLYTAATALVMPSRSEGFGLPAAEAQACGVALVATDATGLAESAHAPFSYALRTTGTRPARADGLPWDFYDGRPMPEPDEEHLVDILRHIYQHRGEARSRGLAASEVQHRRPWRQAAAELLDVIANHSAIPQGRPHE
jgi:glycosyltransferase involved in cell wall biosynthesis